MAAFRSAVRGDRLLGWRGWLLGLAGTWSLPAAMGLVVLTLTTLTGLALGLRPAEASGLLLTLHLAGQVLLVSPLLSWAGLVLLAPMVWLLLRLGLAGWMNIAAAGLAAGSLAGGLWQGTADELAVPFGVGAALILRMIFGWMDPQIFTPR